MLKKLIFIALSYTSIFAYNSIEININNEDLELGASIDMSQMSDAIEYNTVFLGFKYLHTDQEEVSNFNVEDYYELSFLTRRGFSDDFEIGLGMKLNATKDFLTIPLGLEARYILDTQLPIYITGSIYYAPSVLSLQDAKDFQEYRLFVDVEVIENAMITLGYRSLHTNYEKPVSKNIDYNSSLYVGFKFKF